MWSTNRNDVTFGIRMATEIEDIRIDIVAVHTAVYGGGSRTNPA